MAAYSRKIDSQTFQPGTGSKTVNSLINLVDLSHTRELLLELVMTKAATDAGDIFSLHFQCSSDDQLTWNDRAVFPNVLGTVSPTPSATAPITRRMVISQIRDVASTDSSYTPSGSADGAVLTGGQRIDGPFPPISRESGVRKANWRWSIVQTDADADADFRGTLNVYAISET